MASSLSRLSALPGGLRLSLLPSQTIRASHRSTWAHQSSFFTRAPAPRFSFRRSVFWIVPLAGGLALCFAPRPKDLLPSVFSSPTLIPCSSPQQPVQPIIFSPSEANLSLSSRILSLLRDHVWEPILTAKRFVFLFVLFIPVIVSSPMLLIGNAEKRYKGDRWGAVWWYGFLVRRMAEAGPTFIKVSFPVSFCHALLISTPARSMGRISCRPISSSFM